MIYGDEEDDTAFMPNETEDICGETIEHDLINRGRGVGATLYECRRCGTVIIERRE